MNRKWKIILVLIGVLFVGWFTNLFDDTPTPPVKTSIDLTKAGNKTKMEFRISDSWSYLFRLEFYYENQKIYGSKDVAQLRKIIGFNSYDPATEKQMSSYNSDMKFIKRTLSRGGGVNVDENYNPDGTIIPIKLDVYKLENDKQILIFKKFYMTKGKNGAGYDEKLQKHALAREFAYSSLEKGRYLAIIENPQGFPELKGRDIRFAIYRTRKYK